MIVKLTSNENNTGKWGNKGASLCQMSKAGFAVPQGWILDSDVYDAVMAENGLEHFIRTELQNLRRETVRDVSQKLIALLDHAVLPAAIADELHALTEDGILYAVRSSSTKEDWEEHSFAGQYDTFLNVAASDIAQKVIACYQSMFGEVILSYLVDHHISTDDLKMAVVIQEMVDADYSGVCFTVNPATGNDKELLIEVSDGLGERLVSGKTAPQQYRYDWYEDTEISAPTPSFDRTRRIAPERLPQYAAVFRDIQQFFGFPCDIEFAVKDHRLFILQARSITKIRYTGTPYMWTTADFKDGGVSATICTPYMWSLYEYIWEYSLRKFIVDSKILKDHELPPKLGEMFFARPYWNMSAVKKTMSRVIGYKEREFDNEYGIRGNYEGDGETTGMTPRSICRMIPIILRQSRLLHDRQKNAAQYQSELLALYDDYKEKYDRHTIDDLPRTFYQLTHQIYLRSETTYFWQIFLNTIHQSIYKDSLLKYITESEYLSLLGSIDHISHLLPFYEIWDITRTIRQEPKALDFWTSQSIEQITQCLDRGEHCLPEVRRLIDRYGYHSDKELDITYPCYYEEPQPLLQAVKDTVLLDDTFSPQQDKEKGQAMYHEILEKIRQKVPRRRYRKIVKKVENMRRMLWWREEFRDVSTRFYYLLRVYTIAYAKELTERGVLTEPEEVWFLKVGHLWDYQDEKLTARDLQDMIRKNKRYYNAYRHYMSENEIGTAFSRCDTAPADNAADTVKGLGANNGTVTGVARVIRDFSEIDRLRQGDILVTRFTDTGWTPKFAVLSGIVTEYGGILCHAAIVSREYGIPAIVCCKDAMSRIEDGQTITVDGTKGIVIIHR